MSFRRNHSRLIDKLQKNPQASSCTWVICAVQVSGHSPSVQRTDTEEKDKRLCAGAETAGQDRWGCGARIGRTPVRPSVAARVERRRYRGERALDAEGRQGETGPLANAVDDGADHVDGSRWRAVRADAARPGRPVGNGSHEAVESLTEGAPRNCPIALHRSAAKLSAL
jgi:hypothetical protein